MKNLSFWQKTYFLTLALFLAALFGGIAFIGWQNQQQTLSSEVENVKREQQFIAQSLSRDLSALTENTRVRTSALIASYGEYYKQNGVLLEVKNEDESIFTSLPEMSENSSSTPELGKQVWTTQSFGDDQYLIVGSSLSGDFEDYTLTVAHSMEPLLLSWDQMRQTLIFGCILVSVLLAVGLFFILRSLSKPLEKLAGVADEFTVGNFDARATVSSHDEIGALATSFNAMADATKTHITEISTSAEQNARMAANLSHEIRTPLTAIKGYAEYLQLAETSPEESDSALSYIVDESDRLQKISKRILQLYTLEHDDIKLAPLNLADILTKATLSVQAKTEQGQVNLVIDPIEEVFIQGDEILLESLFINLLDNAITASSSGKSIHVKTEVEAAQATVEIIDAGKGLTQEDIDRLGEPFYRPDKGRSRSSGGAGLGVALCQKIAQLHSVALSYQSQPNEGTTASIKFTTL